MVWAKSVKFGCGKARSRTGKIIVVANYEPKVSQLHKLTKCLLDEMNQTNDIHASLTDILYFLDFRETFLEYFMKTSFHQKT